MERIQSNVLLKQDTLRPAMWRFKKSFACVEGLFVFPVLSEKEIYH